MKKIILLSIASLITFFGVAQNMGIGTNAPDASSKLEISSVNSGLLIPRLTAQQRTTIGNPANGLLVYDTDSAAFSYRTGGTWLFLKGNITKANDWSTAGNAGTNADNFIGTTDDQPLWFRIKNINAGRMDSTNFNTALGFRALDPVDAGGSNTAIGFKTLSFNSGYQNTASGAFSLYSNTVGTANTASGINALYSNTTGSTNTAGGAYTLTSNTTGNRNTAHGYQALEFNTTGDRNTASGAFSMINNTTGGSNTAHGFSSLTNNTTGRVNTAIGNYALNKNTTGNGNTATGDSALAMHTSGANNSAFGTFALQAVIVGDGNTAVGVNALGANNFTSRFNTAVGFNAGANASNGMNNVFVGNSTGMIGGLENVVAIGNATLVPTSNTVRLGSSATIRYQAFTDWTNISDGRFKNNIQENVPGLAFINKLRPVTYHLAASALDEFIHRNYKDSVDKRSAELKARSLREKEQITYTGFIAQEVETAAKELGFDFSGVDKPKNDNDTYGIRYAEFVVPLVKAVQEQQQLIQKQQQQMDALAKEIQLLKENQKR